MKDLSKTISCFLAAAIVLSISAFSSASAAKLKEPSFKISNTTAGVKITWKSIKGASKYIVSRKSVKAKKYTALKTVRIHTFVDTNVKDGNKYVYNVTAVKGSSKARAKGKSIVRLSSPEDFSVRLVSDVDTETNPDELGANYSARLSWKKVSGATRYEIQRVTMTGGSIGVYKRIGYSKSTSYEDFEMRSGNRYRFRVRALNGKFKGAFSSSSDKKGYLESAYIFVKTAPDYSSVRVSWEGSTGAEGYTLYKSTDKGKNYTQVKSSDSFKHSDSEYYYDDLDVENGSIYFYYIEAYNSDMTSNKSNMASVYFKDYDTLVAAGESKAELQLSQIYNSVQIASENGVEIKTELKSDDESIAKVNVQKNSDNSYSVIVTGVKEGYIDIGINIKSEAENKTIKARIKVSSEPVYDVTLEKGDSGKIYELNGDGGVLRDYGDFELKVSVISDNTDVVTVNNPESKSFTLTGVSAGETLIKVVIVDCLYGEEHPIINQTFSVKVIESEI